MRIKTKEDALLHCFDLWLWLALNPEKGKRDWPGFELNGGYLETPEEFCPCCEYMAEANLDCKDCIIKWSTDHTDKSKWCCNPKFEFRNWRNSMLLPESTLWALEIAILALTALGEK